MTFPSNSSSKSSFLALKLVCLLTKNGHFFCCHHQRLQRQRSHCQYLVPALQEQQLLHLEPGWVSILTMQLVIPQITLTGVVSAHK